MLSILLALTPISLAVPTQLVQNGRLLDSSGAGVTGTHALTFRVFDVDTGGQALWEDFIITDFNSGYYSVVLGDNPLTPLEDSLLEMPNIYLEVQLDAEPPLSPRQTIQSTPYARIAGKAESIEGGTVDASSVSVNGSLVIDNSGSWVGPTMSVGWSAIQNIPADIADGDDDTLAGISCSTGEILGWNGSQWACAADNGLTEAEVEAYVTNGPLDLDGATTSGGLPILTEGANGTLSGLSCQDGELAKYDQVLGSWACGLDTALSESDVEGFITNGALDWAAGTTLNGQTLMTSPSCNHGEFISYDSNQGIWVCQSVMGLFDTDNDGVLLWEDCDDGDPLVLGQNLDADCDGTFTADDCDDNNPTSTTLALDADCDGAETADDCDDNDASLGAQALDMDCDGAYTADDCNDFDSSLGPIANDADCDGTLTADDCDDNNPNSYTVSIDADCDSILTADDCNDNNPLSTAIADDADCDGAVTALDCDDNNPNSNTLNNDFDCDGSLTGDDCDDSNDQIWPGQTEICENGIDEDCDGVDSPCFSQIEFNSCGVSGQYGPSQSQCDSTYSSTNLSGQVTITDGYQYFTVPQTGTYSINAYGAKGADTSNYYGGNGAHLYGEFYLTQGQVLKILVGQEGDMPSDTWSYGGGGGGGTFVALEDNSPLIVAAGGGGATAQYQCAQYSGTQCQGSPGKSSSNGEGAGCGGSYSDGAGAGYSSNGDGYSFLNGGIGGQPGGPGGAGGFGGGGGPNNHPGGGGGGYHGGNCGWNFPTQDNDSCSGTNGRGGWSYNTGSNANGTDGAHSGNGKVIIDLL